MGIVAKKKALETAKFSARTRLTKDLAADLAKKQHIGSHDGSTTQSRG